MRAVSGAIILALGLAGCASAPPRPQDLIPVSLVINSVKCGFAIALEREASGRSKPVRLTGNVATLQLQLKVVSTQTVSGGVGATGAGIVPWQGLSILPSASASQAKAWAIDTVINASYELNATNTKVCKAAGIDLKAAAAGRDNTYGFASWLGDILAELSRVSLEQPEGTLDKLTYDGTFGVTTDAQGALKLNFAAATANFGVDKNRIDTQHLTIVISGKPAAAAASTGAGARNVRRPDGGGSRGLGPTFTPFTTTFSGVGAVSQ